jgi:3-hydroxypropionyl-coenzyme A dehydratase
MIAADEALKIGLVNKVVVDTKSDVLIRSSEEDEEQIRKLSTQTEEEAPKLLNKKLMDECIKLGGEITKNSYNAVKVSKMLINKGMDADLGWALCFAHEDRQAMMSAFLNMGKR